MKILVLHVPCLHLGFLGCYGNTWIDTPHVDRLAAESVVFDQHYAEHPLCNTAWDGCMNRTTPIPDVFAWLRGNDVPIGAHMVKACATPDRGETELEGTLEQTVEVLDQLANQPQWFLWVQFPDLHPPWNVPESFATRYLTDEPDDEEATDEPFEPLPNPTIGPMDADDLILWERLRCTYAGAVSYFDAGVGLLIEELQQRKLYDDLLVILTSNRGLALGEHGIVGECRPWLHDEVVHVPLIIRQPQAEQAGRRVFALTQPVDLAATFREAFQLAPMPMDGRSLFPLLRNEVETVREHAVSCWAMEDMEEWSLRTPEWAFLLPVKAENRAVQLYAKPEDRWELNNVIQHHQELAEQLEKTLSSER